MAKNQILQRDNQFFIAIFTILLAATICSCQDLGQSQNIPNVVGPPKTAENSGPLLPPTNNNLQQQNGGSTPNKQNIVDQQQQQQQRQQPKLQSEGAVGESKMPGQAGAGIEPSQGFWNKNGASSSSSSASSSRSNSMNGSQKLGQQVVNFGRKTGAQASKLGGRLNSWAQPKISQAGKAVKDIDYNGLQNGLKNVVRSTSDGVKKAASKTGSFLQRALSQNDAQSDRQNGQNTLESMKNNVQKGANKVGQTVAKVSRSASSRASSLLNRDQSSIKNGLKNAASSTWKKAKSVSSRAAKFVRGKPQSLDNSAQAHSLDRSQFAAAGGQSPNAPTVQKEIDTHSFWKEFWATHPYVGKQGQKMEQENNTQTQEGIQTKENGTEHQNVASTTMQNTQNDNNDKQKTQNTLNPNEETPNTAAKSIQKGEKQNETKSEETRNAAAGRNGQNAQNAISDNKQKEENNASAEARSDDAPGGDEQQNGNNNGNNPTMDDDGSEKANKLAEEIGQNAATSISDQQQQQNIGNVSSAEQTLENNEKMAVGINKKQNANSPVMVTGDGSDNMSSTNNNNTSADNPNSAKEKKQNGRDFGKSDNQKDKSIAADNPNTQNTAESDREVGEQQQNALQQDASAAAAVNANASANADKDKQNTQRDDNDDDDEANQRTQNGNDNAKNDNGNNENIAEDKQQQQQRTIADDETIRSSVSAAAGEIPPKMETTTEKTPAAEEIKPAAFSRPNLSALKEALPTIMSRSGEGIPENLDKNTFGLFSELSRPGQQQQKRKEVWHRAESEESSESGESDEDDEGEEEEEEEDEDSDEQSLNYYRRSDPNWTIMEGKHQRPNIKDQNGEEVVKLDEKPKAEENSNKSDKINEENGNAKNGNQNNDIGKIEEAKLGKDDNRMDKIDGKDAKIEDQNGKEDGQNVKIAKKNEKNGAKNIENDKTGNKTFKTDEPKNGQNMKSVEIKKTEQSANPEKNENKKGNKKVQNAKTIEPNAKIGNRNENNQKIVKIEKDEAEKENNGKHPSVVGNMMDADNARRSEKKIEDDMENGGRTMEKPAGISRKRKNQQNAKDDTANDERVSKKKENGKRKHKPMVPQSGNTRKHRRLHHYRPRIVYTYPDFPTMYKANITACISFYTHILGMELDTFVGGTPPVERMALKFGDQKINIHEKGREFEPKAHCPQPGALDLCFIAAVPLSQVIEHLRHRAVPIEEGPVLRTGAKGRIRSVYVRDPDKNLIEISEYELDNF